nr:carbohydrate ABC transporter permease [uncultured Eisenbergiella sp.]
MKDKIIHMGGVLAKLLLLLVFGWPFFWMLSTSLQTSGEVNRMVPTFFPAVPQFTNYLEAWNASGGVGMEVYLKNSVIVVVSVILLQMLVVVPAAYAFAKYEFRLKKLLFGTVLIALMMPAQITFLPIYLLMSEWGLINTLWPQILPFAANAFAIFLLRQYFMQVPEELIEAARLDDASEWKIMYRLMLPMSKPAIATVVLFSFLGTWNEYFWPFVMTNSDRIRPLPVAIAKLKEMEGLANWQVIMAGNTILVIPVLLVYLFASKQIIKSFAYSGIK